MFTLSRIIMSVTMGGGGGALPEIEGCWNAEEFVIEALEASAAARSPSELAQAYDCSKGHMRNVMSDLAASGRVERVEKGLYTDSEGVSDLSPEQTEGIDTHSERSDSEVSEGSEGSVAEPVDDSELEEAEVPEVVEIEETEGMSAGTAVVAGSLALAVAVFAGAAGSSDSSSDEEQADQESVDEESVDESPAPEEPW